MDILRVEMSNGLKSSVDTVDEIVVTPIAIRGSQKYSEIAGKRLQTVSISAEVGKAY